MTDADAGRLVVYDREMHLVEPSDGLAVGDTLEVVRGNGPREGDHMCIATTGSSTKGTRRI